MAIKRVELRDILVFKGTFTVEFCPGINILIGANGTGKTTLIKRVYEEMTDNYFRRDFPESGVSEATPKILSTGNIDTGSAVGVIFDETETTQIIYIPEKDILEHSRGLLPFIEEKQTGFGKIYRNLLIKAMDVPTNYQSEFQQKTRNVIIDIIGGEVEYDNNSGEFVTIHKDGKRIPFANEASGFKKLGLLGLLVKCGRLKENSILIWDEPENSLNPEHIPVLVSILLELADNGVQIFLATHDYNLTRFFDVRKNRNIPVMFYNLIKNEEDSIQCLKSAKYMKLPENHLESANAELFKAVVESAMEVVENE